MASVAISGIIDLYYTKIEEVLSRSEAGIPEKIYIDNCGHVFGAKRGELMQQSLDKRCEVGQHEIQYSFVSNALTSVKKELLERRAREDHLKDVDLACTAFEGFYCDSDKETLLSKPCVDDHGHTFNEDTLEQHRKDNQGNCPLNEAVRHVVEDRALKKCIMFYKNLQESLKKITDNNPQLQLLARGVLPMIPEEVQEGIRAIDSTNLNFEGSKICEGLKQVDPFDLKMSLWEELQNIRTFSNFTTKAQTWSQQLKLDEEASKILMTSLEDAIQLEEKARECRFVLGAIKSLDEESKGLNETLQKQTTEGLALSEEGGEVIGLDDTLATLTRLDDIKKERRKLLGLEESSAKEGSSMKKIAVKAGNTLKWSVFGGGLGGGFATAVAYFAGVSLGPGVLAASAGAGMLFTTLAKVTSEDLGSKH